MIRVENWKLLLDDPDTEGNKLVLFEYFHCKHCGENFDAAILLEQLLLHTLVCKKRNKNIKKPLPFS